MAQFPVERRCQLSWLAIRAHDHPGGASRILQDGLEEGGLWLFCHGLVLAIFGDADDLHAGAVCHFEVAAHRFLDGAEQLTREGAVDDGDAWPMRIVLAGEDSAGE